MTGSGKMKKKYASGEASWYMTRKQALDKLQVNLRDFRRLCILKGIYPREPIKRTRAQKGSTEKKTLYYKKDIQFLLHEPLIWKMWDMKARHKKIQKSKGKRDFEGAQRLNKGRPKYDLDHLVKERYPTFSDALNDLDDPLSLCSLFAIMPTVSKLSEALVSDCRRLTVEFMHYVIESRALRKAFISIKGYYFQAEVQGIAVTWVMPHHFVYMRPENVDMKVMAIFSEFYTTLLGFVNYRLYHSLNLMYPPKLALTGATPTDTCMSTRELDDERVAALNTPLARARLPDDADDADDDAELALMAAAAGEELEEVRRRRQRTRRLQRLFAGCRVFIGREVPREPMVFAIRALGGTCSWDASCAPGATYSETDETITHQLIDRAMPQGAKKYTSRYYVQPQWVFDSVNCGDLRPVQLYFPGVELPPHLSPFKEEEVTWGEYVPPDKLKLLGQLQGTEQAAAEDGVGDNPSSDEDADEDQESADEKQEDEDNEESDGEEEDSDGGEEMEDESAEDSAKAKMKVTPGKIEKVDDRKDKMKESKEDFWMRARMIKKKDKHRFYKLLKRKKLMQEEARLLTKKRQIVEKEMAERKRQEKKQMKTALAQT
ncbi:pescadillo homolog [Amphibalanus amphitrite]|uniref:pescadillo homolog n=1 Tax=Amphibalanus amphitrite TaxID=1232801 RepID=UPI001C900B22|nr:pescadillo homolog [Amphibalanus amphitrite]XP_043213634.1 pescadillo homolog [Amphibalanus amphitrite]XP_043213635.1 pescadillo homolog [Amphibalanus amphitrite]XP_043213636.1 pescadillo homolog [Amphibalanus amphitrite]